MAGFIRTFSLSICLLAYVGCLHLEADKASREDLVIDRVWSGHPVGFDILTSHGHQFVAYYDAKRRLSVAQRKVGETEWTITHPEGVYLPNRRRSSNVTAWDSHNYLTMALDRKGYLHLSGNMHNDPLIYYRSSRPFDASSLERLDRMIGQREQNTTYPVFFKNGDGELFFRYRDGGSGNGSDLYNAYDADRQKWERVLDQALIDGEGRRNAYALDPIVGPDGRFHLLWMWRDTPDAATNHTLSYARSLDLVSWEQCDGSPIELPITLGEGDILDDARVGEGLINTTYRLGFDERNRPVAVYHRYDEDGKSQVYATRPTEDASSWTKTQLTDWDHRWSFGGGGSIVVEVTLDTPKLEEDGSLIVPFSTHHAGSGRWKLDPETLEVDEMLPPEKSPLPEHLAHPQTDWGGIEVRTATSRDASRRWVLRWETLPENRDRPRQNYPGPTELRVIEVSD